MSVKTKINDKWVIQSSGSNGGVINGVSPIVYINKEDGVTTLTITDVHGQKIATINDGENGYTPIKGTDYFTDDDKIEFVNQVISALPDGDEVSY